MVYGWYIFTYMVYKPTCNCGGTTLYECLIFSRIGWQAERIDFDRNISNHNLMLHPNPGGNHSTLDLKQQKTTVQFHGYHITMEKHNVWRLNQLHYYYYGHYYGHVNVNQRLCGYLKYPESPSWICVDESEEGIIYKMTRQQSIFCFNVWRSLQCGARNR